MLYANRAEYRGLFCTLLLIIIQPFSGPDGLQQGRPQQDGTKHEYGRLFTGWIFAG
jgi:hypothetical protein